MPSASPRPDHWHAITRGGGRESQEGHLLREAAFPDHSRGAGHGEGRAQAQSRAANRQHAALVPGVLQGLHAGAQRTHRQDQAGHRGCGHVIPVVRPAGRNHGAGTRIGTCGWGPAPPRRLQLHPQPARGSQGLPGLAQVSRILRRRHDGLGRAPLRHRAVGLGHG